MNVKTFWITNISNKNVTLSDLYISVPSMGSINLLDKKHYNFTEEQLKQSASSGSIYKKSDKIKVRKVPPQMISRAQILIDPHSVMPARTNSIYEIKQEHYEELDIGDDTLMESSESLDKDNIVKKGDK